MKAFDAFDVEYVGGTWTSVRQSQAELRTLKIAAVEWKREFMGEFFKHVRTILEDPSNNSQIVRTPTLNLRKLISAGRTSPTAGQVYNAAMSLEAWVNKLSTSFPGMKNYGPDTKDVKMSTSVSWFVKEGSEFWGLLAPETRIIGTYRLERREPQSRALTPVGTSALHPATYGTIFTAGAIVAVGFGESAIGTNEVIVAAVPAFANCINVTATPGELFEVTISREAINTVVVGVPGPAVPAAPVGTVCQIESADGVRVPGSNFVTLRGAPSRITFVGTTAGIHRLRLSAIGGYVVVVQRLKRSGQLALSPDGEAEPINVNDPKVISCIGGRNVASVLTTLNFARFEQALSIVHLAAEAHGNIGIFNNMNLYYQTYARNAELDFAPALDSFMRNPLKNADFWLGANEVAGITKDTRQRLFRKYYALARDYLAILEVDGEIDRFLDGSGI
jgi:hypothetical protein